MITLNWSVRLASITSLNLLCEDTDSKGLSPSNIASILSVNTCCCHIISSLMPAVLSLTCRRSA